MGDKEDSISKALYVGKTKRKSSVDVVAEALSQKPKRMKLTWTEPVLIPPSVPKPQDGSEAAKRSGDDDAGGFTSAAWCKGIIAGAASKDDTEAFVEKITKRTARGLGHARDLLGELPSGVADDAGIDPGEGVGRLPKVDCHICEAAREGTSCASHQQGYCTAVAPRLGLHINPEAPIERMDTLQRRDESRAQLWSQIERSDTPNPQRQASHVSYGTEYGTLAQ